LPAADPARQHLVQRVHCDSEDQGPDHQRQERRKYLAAERREREDQAGADQHVEQHRRLLLLGCGMKGQGRIHIASPSARARTELVLSRECGVHNENPRRFAMLLRAAAPAGHVPRAVGSD
jgi:hypothetical protein